MAGDNKVLTVLVGAVAGILVAGSLVLAVTMGINIAVAPLGAAIKDVGKVSAGVEALTARIKSLETEIVALKKEVAARPQQPAAQPAPQMPPAEDMNKVYDIPVAGSYVLGKADAKVTIVEFSDFQCPFCGRFHPFINEAYKAFPNDVKVMIKNFPLGFHPNARPAAKAALAAGLQGKYFEMVDLLVANGNDLSEAKYKEFAAKIGINVDQFTKDLKEKDAEFEKKIEADIALGGQIDVRGTPTYFLNGKKTTARSAEQWKSEIEAVLKK